MNRTWLKDFGANLKALRESKGLSQARMSEILEIMPTAYGFYEKGLREPTMSKLRLLADYFNISVDKLVLSNFTKHKIFWADLGCHVDITESAKIELTLPAAGQVIGGGSAFQVRGMQRKILFPSKDSFISFSATIQRKFKTDFYANVNQALLDEYHKIQDGESDFKGLSVDEKPFEQSFVSTQ